MRNYYISEIHSLIQLSGNWVFSKTKKPVIGLMLVTLRELSDENHIVEKNTQKILIPFSGENVGIDMYKRIINLEKTDIELEE